MTTCIAEDFLELELENGSRIISHHGVVNDHSKSTPLRVVVNSACPTMELDLAPMMCGQKDPIA